MALSYPTQTYITVAAAREYATTMGLSVPDDDLDAGGAEGLETLLKRSAIYLDRHYGHRYIGNRTTIPQTVLYWPRTQINYYDSTGNYRSDLTITSVPVELGYAQVELVSMLFDGEFNPYIQPNPSIRKEINKLEGIESLTEYAGNGSEGFAINPWYRIDLILAPLIKPFGEKQGRITMTRGA